ncbi:MAG: hypothetical protein LRY54_00070 [Alphaproteobacteria bacterium]|nr:hypothetical protein [Alphaproteobacteria bacterium]
MAGLSQHQFGLWSALAIHDTSSVVGPGCNTELRPCKPGRPSSWRGRFGSCRWFLPYKAGNIRRARKEPEARKNIKPGPVIHGLFWDF